MRFTNLSTAPTGSTFAWDFGDGSPVVQDKDPSHLYQETGNYSVNLTVTTHWQKAAETRQVVQAQKAKALLPILAGGEAVAVRKWDFLVTADPRFRVLAPVNP